MSEIPLETMPFDWLQQAMEVRRAEFAPALADLVLQATSSYEQLRPVAKWVGEVPMDYPLRYQYVNGLNPDHSLGGVVADYLMIGFGNHHNLTLYHDQSRSSYWEWRLQRSVVSDELETTNTTILTPSPTTFAEIEVAKYKYREKIGLNGTCDGFVCIWGRNGYADAEQHIADFQTDLQSAVEQLGS